jgi:DNA-binding MarR family transcriptional regulator
MASVSKNASEKTAASFASLVASMSRFIVALSENPAFRSAGLSLSEWVALSVLSQTPGLSAGRLGVEVGVRGPRINQIADALLKRGLISSVASKDDPRKKQLSVTSEGIAQTKLLNAEVQRLVSQAFGDREQLLSGMITRTQQLTRIAGLAKAGKDSQSRPAAVSPVAAALRRPK